MSYIVQILLPVYDNSRCRFPAESYDHVRSELTEQFGGLTAYMRAPAEGLWEAGSEMKRDDIVILEIMSDTLDRLWWREYRGRLERRFRQDRLVVRAQTYEAL
jgi:hypothetical protein